MKKVDPISNLPHRVHRAAWIGPGVILLIVLGIFGDVLFSDGTKILSLAHLDLVTQFIPWRQWGFSQMLDGHLPLWNPYVFCGTPFVGMFQSALFYPLNAFYLVLPVGHATNWNIALHAYVAAILMYQWARYRQVGYVGSTLAGVTYMLCAPYVLHVMPGHIPFLNAATWAPLIFLVADGLIDRPSLPWTLLGTLAVTMQVLAGSPQPAYIAALAGSLYLGLNLFLPQLRRWRAKESTPGAWKKPTLALAAWIAMYSGAAVISAAQLGAAQAASAESGRSEGKANWTFASTFPIPISNAVNLLVPNFWGDNQKVPYYGEWFIWEATPYYGAVALALAIYAAIARDRRRRFAWTVALVMLILALGKQTPLYRVLYDIVPMFGRFRGSGRFAYGAAPLIALLAGMGWESLGMKNRRVLWLAIPALLCAGAAIYWADRFHQTAEKGADGDWGKILAWTAAKSDPKLDPEIRVDLRQFTPAAFLPDNLQGKLGPTARGFADISAHNSAEYVAGQLQRAAIVLTLFGLLTIGTIFDRRASWLVAMLLIAELILYERSIHATTDLRPSFPMQWVLAPEQLQDGRVVCLGDLTNYGMLTGMQNVWGYDPITLIRTTEFVAYSQGTTSPQKLDELVNNPVFSSKQSDRLALLRCRYMLGKAADFIALPMPGAMPHLQLIGNAMIESGRDAVLARVFSSSFDPRRSVVLENPPEIIPQGNLGNAQIVNETTDTIEIEATVDQPTILLVTDAYSRGWQARALEADEQGSYKVMPADWMLRAVPLTKGRHHFIMEYSPVEWRLGKVVSLIGLTAYVILSGWSLYRWRSQ